MLFFFAVALLLARLHTPFFLIHHYHSWPHLTGSEIECARSEGKSQGIRYFFSNWNRKLPAIIIGNCTHRANRAFFSPGRANIGTLSSRDRVPRVSSIGCQLANCMGFLFLLCLSIFPIGCASFLISLGPRLYIHHTERPPTPSLDTLQLLPCQLASQPASQW